MDFRKGYIMAGDLNFCLDPEIDSMACVEGIRNKSLKMIKQKK